MTSEHSDNVDIQYTAPTDEDSITDHSDDERLLINMDPASKLKSSEFLRSQKINTSIGSTNQQIKTFDPNTVTKTIKLNYKSLVLPKGTGSTTTTTTNVTSIPSTFSKNTLKSGLTQQNITIISKTPKIGNQPGLIVHPKVSNIMATLPSNLYTDITPKFTTQIASIPALIKTVPAQVIAGPTQLISSAQITSTPIQISTGKIQIGTTTPQITQTGTSPLQMLAAPTNLTAKLPPNTSITQIKKINDNIVTSKQSPVANVAQDSISTFCKPIKVPIISDAKLNSNVFVKNINDKPSEGLVIFNIPISSASPTLSDRSIPISGATHLPALFFQTSDSIHQIPTVRQDLLPRTTISSINNGNTSASTSYQMQFSRSLATVGSTQQAIDQADLKKGTARQQKTFRGLGQIPKDTVIKKISSKEMALIDLKKTSTPKPADAAASKSIEPTVTITQKPLGVQKTPAVNPGGSLLLDRNNPSNAVILNVNISNGNIMDPQGIMKVLDQRLKEFRIEKVQKGQQEREDQNVTATTSNDVCTIIPIELPGEQIQLNRESSPSPTISTTTSNYPSEKIQNKFLTSVNVSPRLQRRSKSIHICAKQGRIEKRRRNRLPSAPSIVFPTDEKPMKSRKNSIHLNAEKNDENQDLKIFFNPLECSEKLDESDKSKSVSPIDNGPAKTQTTTTTAKKSITKSWHRDNPWAYIKWKQNIGYLPNSRLHFKENEFGLIDVLNEINDFESIDKEFQETLNNNEDYQPMDAQSFVCRVCYRQTDKELCRIECSVIYNARHNRLKLRRDYIAKVCVPPVNLNSNGSKNVSGFQDEPVQFSWEKYLQSTIGTPASVSLFINPFPCFPNNFDVGMKLEAIDPNNASFFCVCTIVEKQGYRIKLRFDGYDMQYDFWRNADSVEIFPPGWCSENSIQLHPPLGYGNEPFDWHIYATRENAKLASRSLFHHLNSKIYMSQYKIGMKLEAFDIRNNKELRVATIGGIIFNRFLIQFDYCPESYDYWTDIDSPYIRPINWHAAANIDLIPPPKYMSDFKWSTYLKNKKSEALPPRLFHTRPPINFKIGMRLEVVDRKVPALIRPASVVDVRDYEIQILYDAWPPNYAYWVNDDDPDIHPIKWCEHTGHPIECPSAMNLSKFKSSCGVLGCKELGNAKYPDMAFHYNLMECPYESRNWDNTTVPKRLEEYYKEKKMNVKNLRQRSILRDQLKRMKIDQNEITLDGIARLNDIPSTSATLVTATTPVEMLETIEMKDENDSKIIHPTKAEMIKEAKKRIDITCVILDQYGPRVQEGYTLWKRNSVKLEIEPIKPNLKNPMDWSFENVVDYVSQLHHHGTELGETFRQHEIDGTAFLSLSQDDLLNRMQLRLGPSIKIYNQIVALREEVAVTYLK